MDLVSVTFKEFSIGLRDNTQILVFLAGEPCHEEDRGQVSWTRGSISFKSNRLLDSEDSSAYSSIVHAQEIPASTVAEIALDVGPSSTADAPASVPSLEAVAAITATSDQAGTSVLRKAEVQSSSQLISHTTFWPKEASVCCIIQFKERLSQDTNPKSIVC